MIRFLNKRVDSFVRSGAYAAMKNNQPAYSCAAHPNVWQLESNFDHEFWVKHAIEAHGLSRDEALKIIYA